MPTKIVLIANADWYLYSFRLSMARALRSAGHEVLLFSPPRNRRKARCGSPWVARRRA